MGPIEVKLKNSSNKNYSYTTLQQEAEKSFIRLSQEEHLPNFKNENFRYTKVKDIQISRKPFISKNTENLPESANNLDDNENLFSIQACQESNFPIIDGVKLYTIQEAYEKLDSSILDDFDLTDGLNNDVFAQLSLARHLSGYLLFVPDHTKVELPLRCLNYFNAESDSFIARTLIYIGECSELTFIDEHTGNGLLNGKNPLSSQLNQFSVQKNAKLNYTFIQNYGSSVLQFSRQSFVIHSDAKVEYTSIGLGGLKNQTKCDAHCVGKGAEFVSNGVTRANHAQHFDFWAEAHHHATHTRSNIQHWNALDDESSAVFNGNLIIPIKGLHTEAYQKNINLLLSKKARIYTLPKLEIATDEVACAHGASISPLDENQIFYLCSRGIKRQEAELMLIHAFAEPVVRKLPSAALAERIREEIKKKHYGKRHEH